MKLQELVSTNSTKLRVKKPSISDTFKNDKTYREEIENLHTLIASKKDAIETLEKTIEQKQQELDVIENRNNLEFDQIETLEKKYLDYEQSVKQASIESQNAEQGTAEKKDILEKIKLEESVLRKDLIDIQDKVSSANTNLSEVTFKANEKISESNTAQQKLDSAIENLKVVENALGIKTASLRELENEVGEKKSLLERFIEEASDKQKELVPIDKLLEEIREKQELSCQLTAQAEELKTILDDGAKLSLSFQSTMEESDKKQRLRHQLLLLEIKDLDVVVSEKSDHISDLDTSIQTLKTDIETQQDAIKELQKQEMELKTSIDDIEFRKIVKTTPEVSVVPTLGLSESPFHKKVGVS